MKRASKAMTDTTRDPIVMVAGQIGGVARAVVILTASLHGAGVLNGNAIAASLRLDQVGNDDARGMMVEIADLIRRTIDANDEPQAMIGPID